MKKVCDIAKSRTNFDYIIRSLKSGGQKSSVSKIPILKYSHIIF